MAMASRSRCKTCANGSIQATNEALSLDVIVYFLSIYYTHFLSIRSFSPFTDTRCTRFLGTLIFVRVVTTIVF